MKKHWSDMTWLNEPVWSVDGDSLKVHTGRDTDYWQRTHYGFRRDNAHALVADVAGDFVLRARFTFSPNAQYDQCGLILRHDESCWFKCSTEYEDAAHSRLGSVMTNHGYSDWATQDVVSDFSTIWYEIAYSRGDIIARYSLDGANFRQMRIGHLDHADESIKAGIYGCSPTGPGFRFSVSEFEIVGKM